MMQCTCERHRADGVRVGRQPPGVGDDQLTAWFILHDAPVKDAAEAAEHIVGIPSGLPLDGVDAKRPRGRHGPYRLPPDRQGHRIEKRSKHTRWRGGDEDRVIEREDLCLAGHRRHANDYRRRCKAAMLA